MKVNLCAQIHNSSIPPAPAHVFSGSALPLSVEGIPQRLGASEVVGVSVSVTNADGVPMSAPCVRAGDFWYVAFAGSCFEHTGVVNRGVKYIITLKTPPGGTIVWMVAVGDLVVDAATPDAEPGDPTRSYVIRGEDTYHKSDIVDGVQHYKKMELVYDDEMSAWGAEWTGDYILVDGNYTEVEG